MSDSTRSICKRDAGVARIEASCASFSDKKARVLSHGSQDFYLQNHLSLPGFTEKLIDPASCATSGETLVQNTVQDGQSSSFCSSNDSCEIVKDSLTLVDLKAPAFETEIKSRENTPTSGNRRDVVAMETAARNSLVAKKVYQKKPPAVKMPSQAEIDEFFAAAEKYDQKRFAEKYNYDIVKDAPLEGRFEWVLLESVNEKEIEGGERGERRSRGAR